MYVLMTGYNGDGINRLAQVVPSANPKRGQVTVRLLQSAKHEPGAYRTYDMSKMSGVEWTRHYFIALLAYSVGTW